MSPAPEWTIARSCAASASGCASVSARPRSGRLIEEGRRLVPAEVERAHRRHAAAERGEQRLERGAMLLLGRPGRRLEERELRAQETDAGGPGGEARVDLGRRRRVAEERDPAAVECLGRQAAQPRERAATTRALAQGLLRLLELRRVPDRPRATPCSPSRTSTVPSAIAARSAPNATAIGRPSERATIAAWAVARAFG